MRLHRVDSSLPRSPTPPLPRSHTTHPLPRGAAPPLEPRLPPIPRRHRAQLLEGICWALSWCHYCVVWGGHAAMDMRGKFPSGIMDQILCKVINDIAVAQRKEILEQMAAEGYSPMPARKVK